MDIPDLFGNNDNVFIILSHNSPSGNHRPSSLSSSFSIKWESDTKTENYCVVDQPPVENLVCIFRTPFVHLQRELHQTDASLVRFPFVASRWIYFFIDIELDASVNI